MYEQFHNGQLLGSETGGKKKITRTEKLILNQGTLLTLLSSALCIIGRKPKIRRVKDRKII